MLIEEVKNKKIAIVGFAREGRDTLAFLAKTFPKKNKSEIAIFDQEKIKETQALKKQGIFVFTDKNYLDHLKNYQVIIKTPGIPEKKIEPFLGKGARVTSQTEIFFANFKGLCIGVTGTKGKGTTATLIYQILKEAGFKVKLVGNIGQPVFQFLLKSKPTDIFVYELSSHQLQGLKKSPKIAVFLNLFPDHLDYYRDFNSYKKAKEPIVSFQGKNDFFIYNTEDQTAREFAGKSQAKKIAFNKISLKGDRGGKVKTLLKGDFNLLNIKAAFAVGKLLGVGEGQMKKTIASFKGLEHRLEYVGKFRGIGFYNDSMSTLPEVAIKAIEAVKPQTLIAGGSCKGSDYKEMAKAIIKHRVKNLILLEKPRNKRNPGEKETADLLSKELSSFEKGKELSSFRASKMKEAVAIAFKETGKGRVCLLSPGAASFNLFKSYADRGKQFKLSVKVIK
ncbi:UDP-N-acetylmuramoyl-L-alanine--D-glutamate ligase [bacterium (Candidatus Gribaldobacteria) CG10_big_fil_rev_8_21_14_0_10_37_21]|uniref:UDP-N-acetylmuramoylalanine--D-glutamate ligase n=1 Tax=bacterium (Candidatus Gribaldobacteria) CG10_big_fil_rev_8_21_14_0_10_37_21 TaxID=2014275 RepID=A0A2H0UVD0_9BACT|nr:MAG: UDP-N-acetylmuramoylalanine--D-glutamate ligase [Parcubacteria group bacterium CG1_02_37_13]PIR90778.1 MAG: UDP-N-acetylmuramoyl-L-alanine--D-glutamate ligase [bacterium (Candidatus Gribaldobacteria) CG10_big_fil_rev_8_21_14_0_10_37_21]